MKPLSTSVAITKQYVYQYFYLEKVAFFSTRIWMFYLSRSIDKCDFEDWM